MTKESQNNKGPDGTEKTWSRLVLGTLCCGFSVVSGHVHDAPPILRGFYRKPVSKLFDWIVRRGGTVERLKSYDSC